MDRFEQALISNMGAFGLDLSPETLEQLGAFYSLLTRWNERLHLVAPCSPEEFATRHVLESLMLLKHLPQDAKIADIGSGAGLPIIPCLIARPDLQATLIESSQKKSVFLREALNQLGRPSVIIPKPFEEVRTSRRLLRHLPRTGSIHNKVSDFDSLGSGRKHVAFVWWGELARTVTEGEREV